METRTVLYRGPAPLVGALASALRGEGVQVDYTPPMERRGAVEVAETVALSLVCNGTYDLLKYGLHRFRKCFGDYASAEIVDDRDRES